jgi:hypothetical protein
VGFHDANDAEIHREDAAERELRDLVADGSSRIVINRRFVSARQPTSWTVWPVSRSRGWLDKVVGVADLLTCQDALAGPHLGLRD